MGVSCKNSRATLHMSPDSLASAPPSCAPGRRGGCIRCQTPADVCEHWRVNSTARGNPSGRHCSSKWAQNRHHIFLWWASLLHTTNPGKYILKLKKMPETQGKQARNAQGSKPASHPVCENHLMVHKVLWHVQYGPSHRALIHQHTLDPRSHIHVSKSQQKQLRLSCQSRHARRFHFSPAAGQLQ